MSAVCNSNPTSSLTKLEEYNKATHAELRRIDLSSETVTKKLMKIVTEAEKLFASGAEIPAKPKLAPGVIYQMNPYGQALSVLEHFKVCKPREISAMFEKFTIKIPCDWCEHVTENPKTYEILNSKSMAELRFDSQSLHELVVHQFYGLRERSISPIQLADLVGLRP